MEGLFLLLGILAILAIGFLLGAIVMSFAGQNAQAQRRWRWASAGCLTVLLGGCAVVTFGIQGLVH